VAEPWNLRKPAARTADTIETYIIFCEDEHHEPAYFKTLQTTGKVKINTIGNQKQSKLNLNNTIQYCYDNGLMEFDAGGYRPKQGITEQIWCVYDRDLESTNLVTITAANNVNFDTAIQTAQNAGIKVAWSNDAFELWILLHFEDVPAAQMLHREYIYSRLTEVLKVIQPRTADLDALTSNVQFGYKTAIKKRLRFDNFVLPFLKSRSADAVQRAEKLAATFGAQIRYHERNPCTMVHLLVESILTAQR